MEPGHYRVLSPLSAVCLDGDRVTGVVTLIPPTAEIEIRGSSRLEGMIEIRWDGKLCAIFQQDLGRKAESPEDDPEVASCFTMIEKLPAPQREKSSEGKRRSATG